MIPCALWNFWSMILRLFHGNSPRNLQNWWTSQSLAGIIQLLTNIGGDQTWCKCTCKFHGVSIEIVHEVWVGNSSWPVFSLAGFLLTSSEIFKTAPTKFSGRCFSHFPWRLFYDIYKCILWHIYWAKADPIVNGVKNRQTQVVNILFSTSHVVFIGKLAPLLFHFLTFQGAL